MKKGLFLLLFIGLGFGGWGILMERSSQRDLVEKQVLTLYGNVEFRRANLGFRVGGRIEKIHFEEGDWVPKGSVLASLDQKPGQENLAVSLAQEEQARAHLELLENGSRPQEIEVARATLAEYQAALKLAEANFERSQTLVKQKVVSEGEFDSDCSSHAVAKARVNRAEQTLNLLIEGPRKEEIAAARALLAEANANRSRMETALADTLLLSPTDGVILTRVEEEGSVVQMGQTIVTLALNKAVWVYVYVDEEDLGKISPGMRAEIRTDSSDNVYSGQIGYISPEAQFTPKNVETTQLRTDLVYRVRILVDAVDHGLRQGMPVTVTIPLNDQKLENPEVPAKNLSETNLQGINPPETISQGENNLDQTISSKDDENDLH